MGDVYLAPEGTFLERFIGPTRVVDGVKMEIFCGASS